MKIKNNITEKKLTKSELEVREKVIKDLKKNKSSLVKRYGKDAEAVMYGRATNIAKKMAESENKNRIKELVKKSLMKEDEVSQDKDHKITQEGNLWVLVYKNKNKTFKHHFSSKKEAEEFWNNNKNSDNSMKFEEGKKEDVTGDGKIDSKDYLAKRDIAIQKAKSKVKNESLEGIKTSEDLDKLKSYLKELTDEGIIHREVYNNILSLVKQIIISTKPQSEDLNEDIDLGHEDNEPHMIKGELYRIGKYAMELYAMAEELEETGQEIDFPSWWQSMITDASTKMVKAKHYLDFELKEPAIDAVVDKLTGEKPHMGEPRTHMMESAYDYVKTPKEYITLQLSDFFRVPKTNLMSFNLDGTDDIEALTQALNSTSPQGTERYLKSSIKSAQDHFDLTEGFLDRMKASVKGAVAGVGQVAKNIGSAVKGDSSQFKSVSNTANMAKLGQKVKTFGKEIDDVINDINKLFPKEKLDKDPKLKEKIEKYLATLNQTKTLNAAITDPDTTTPPVKENFFMGRNPYNMGSSYSDYSSDSDISIDILASKIAKALKNPENQNEDDQNNIKQARKALNLGDVEVAKKIAKPYITEKIAKQLKEDPEQNYPEELDGEYEGKPQKIQGADIYNTLKDILDISNSENDFIKKMTDSLTDETSTLSKSSEEKLRNWYKKNVTN